MHLTDVEHGDIGSYAIVGAHLPIACGAAWAAQLRETGPGRRLLLRRRRDQHRRVPRGAELRGRLEAAGRVRLREQPLHGVHADREVTAVEQPGRGPCGGVRAARRSWSTATTSTPCYAGADRGVARARDGEGPTLVEARDLPARRAFAAPIPATYRTAERGREWLRARPGRSLPARGCSTIGRAEATLDRDGRARSRRGRRRRARRPRRRPTPDADERVDRHLGRRGIDMAELTYRQAVAAAIAQEMPRRPRSCSRRGHRRGRRRVQDDAGPAGASSARSASAIRRSPSRRSSGAAMGAAMTGLRPVAEIMFSDFFAVCWDSSPTRSRRPAT